MSNPLVDTTTLIAVESLFRKGKHDPWGVQLAGDLADLVIYGDTVRCGLGLPNDNRDEDGLADRPKLFGNLSKRDSAVFQIERYSTEEPLTIKEEYLTECVPRFESYAKTHRTELKQWIALHSRDWIRSYHATHVQRRYVYSVEALRARMNLEQLSTNTGIEVDDLCYVFDVILRFPIYGALTGSNERYLNHPIRDAFPLPTMESSSELVPQVPVAWSSAVSRLAKSLTQDEYEVLLHEMRGTVRDLGLHTMRAGSVSQEMIREIAAKVRLPPRIRRFQQARDAAVDALNVGAVLVAPLGLAATVLSCSKYLWNGGLPRSAASIRWLRWTMQWETENQATERR